MSSEMMPVPHDLAFEATIRRLDVAEQVFKRYHLLRILGRGGMGVVWLARDERLDREVALKFLPDEIALDPEAEDEMKRETRRCLELTHANIIRIYDFVKDRQAAAISMEYIDGQTLSAVKMQQPNRVFEIADLAPWLLQTCQALHYAHTEVGVVHRDLKPSNLMVTSRGQIKIADFGIAQSVSDSLGRMTMRRGTSGTLAYMSPQQMGGEQCKPTDDVYALGATIYEMLTSKPPFYSGNVSFQLRVMIPPPLRERRDELEIRGAEIPPEWEETVAACLSKVPEERPQSMTEVAERLGLIAKRHSTPAPVEVKERRGTWPSTQDLIAAFRQAVKAVPRPGNIPFQPKPILKKIAAAGAGLVVAVITGLELYRTLHFAPPGQVKVETSPAGAVVTIAGRQAVTTPAVLTELSPGIYTLQIRAEGFEPLEEKVEIKSNAKITVGPLTLTRAYGSCLISTLPPHGHYTLESDDASIPFHQEGIAPNLISPLPAGRYRMTVNVSGFPPLSQEVQIPAHVAEVENVDLIQSAILAGASDGAARAFRSQSAVIDANLKGELQILSRHAFQTYLENGFLGRASMEIDRLKALGLDVTDVEAALNLKQASAEAKMAADLQRFIQANRVASAENLLKTAGDNLGADAIARLTAQLVPALNSYHMQIDLALKTVVATNPAQAEVQLEKLASLYPDDSRLQLALDDVLMQLPPDAARLERQIDALRHFVSQDASALADPETAKVFTTFADESQKMSLLEKTQSDAKAALDNATAKIKRLKSLEDDYQDRRIGKPKTDPFSSTLNFFGKVVTGHAVVETEPVFSSRQEKEDAINALDTQIAEVTSALPALQDAFAQAQTKYNDFMASVPWK